MTIEEFALEYAKRAQPALDALNAAHRSLAEVQYWLLEFAKNGKEGAHGVDSMLAEQLLGRAENVKLASASLILAGQYVALDIVGADRQVVYLMAQHVRAKSLMQQVELTGRAVRERVKASKVAGMN